MKQRNPVLRVLLSLLITAVLGALYFYITIPAINGHSESFYIFIIVLCVIYLVVSRLLGGGKGKKSGDSAPKQTILEPDGKGGLRVNRASLRRQKNKASAKQLKSVPVLIIALCAAVWIVGTVISAVIFHPKAYYNLLDVQTGDFAQMWRKFPTTKSPCWTRTLPASWENGPWAASARTPTWSPSLRSATITLRSTTRAIPSGFPPWSTATSSNGSTTSPAVCPVTLWSIW